MGSKRVKSECPERVCEVCGGKCHSKEFHKITAMCTSDSFKDSVDYSFIAVETDESVSAVDGARGDCPNFDDGGQEVWIADSAATSHMTPSRDFMYV